jgi:hypothetical protein
MGKKTKSPPKRARGYRLMRTGLVDFLSGQFLHCFEVRARNGCLQAFMSSPQIEHE